jgi:hypothetical protein
MGHPKNQEGGKEMEVLRVYINDKGNAFDILYVDSTTQRRWLLERIFKELGERKTKKVIGMCQMATFFGIEGADLVIEVPPSLALSQVKLALLNAGLHWNPVILLLKGEETEKFVAFSRQ